MKGRLPSNQETEIPLSGYVSEELAGHCCGGFYWNSISNDPLPLSFSLVSSLAPSFHLFL